MEKPDRLHAQPPQAARVAHPGHAQGERGEHERHYDHEEQAKKELTYGLGAVLYGGEDPGMVSPKSVHHHAPEPTEQQAQQNLHMQRQVSL